MSTIHENKFTAKMKENEYKWRLKGLQRQNNVAGLEIQDDLITEHHFTGDIRFQGHIDEKQVHHLRRSVFEEWHSRRNLLQKIIWFYVIVSRINTTAKRVSGTLHPLSGKGMYSRHTHERAAELALYRSMITVHTIHTNTTFGYGS